MATGSRQPSVTASVRRTSRPFTTRTKRSSAVSASRARRGVRARVRVRSKLRVSFAAWRGSSSAVQIQDAPANRPDSELGPSGASQAIHRPFQSRSESRPTAKRAGALQGDGVPAPSHVRTDQKATASLRRGLPPNAIPYSAEEGTRPESQRSARPAAVPTRTSYAVCRSPRRPALAARSFHESWGRDRPIPTGSVRLSQRRA